jgi:hypothetical protein
MESDGLDAALRLHPQHCAIRRCNAYRRSAANTQLLDRFPDGFNVAAFKLDKVEWQLRLVDQDQIAVLIADPTQRFIFCRHGGVARGYHLCRPFGAFRFFLCLRYPWLTPGATTFRRSAAHKSRKWGHIGSDFSPKVSATG